MKNTQKKLKAKHFRYLSKGHVKDPDSFLKEIVHQWGINWSSNFDYLINSSLYPPMRTKHNFSYGFIQVHMAQMIEIAYIIITKCHLSPTPKEEVFQYPNKETFDAVLEDNITFPKKILCDFFGFKTLKQWHSVVGDLSLSRDIFDAKKEDIRLDVEYVAIRELLAQLPKALQEIYDRGGLQFCLPHKIQQV